VIEEVETKESSSSEPETNTTISSPVIRTDVAVVDTKDRQQCFMKYGRRRYLPQKYKQLPPLLYTFPGSGNTWSRLLIEYATGIYTGSVYNDGSLLKALPGEFTCNWEVSVIKAHPHTHPAMGLINGNFVSDDNKCQRGGVPRFERAVLLLRDPFDSIWSEFQRRVSQSHVSGIPKESFSWARWQANAAALSHLYDEMWKRHHVAMEKHWSLNNVLYVKYEDLKNKQTRVATLQKIVDFLRIRHIQIDDTHLECAFTLAENREAHRKIDSTMMTKQEAYIEEVACRMWNLFGDSASAHGYSVWKGLNCTGYTAIPRINVGPHGDYDHRWVKPGMKLLDFRGLPKEAISNNQQGVPANRQSSLPPPPRKPTPPAPLIPHGIPSRSSTGDKTDASNPRKPKKPPAESELPGTFEEIAALRKKERKVDKDGSGSSPPKLRNKLRKVPSTSSSSIEKIRNKIINSKDGIEV